MQKIWQKNPTEVFDNFAKKSQFNQGLSTKEAKENFLKYGENKIPEKKRSLIKMFLSQFANFLIGILFIALVISIVIPFFEHKNPTIINFADAIVIGAIMIVNALFGFWEEFKVEKEIETLSQLSSPKTKVLRDGEVKIIDSSQIVPGDIIIFEEGDQVSADARIIESINMLVNESLLTGESAPVSKFIKKISQEKLALADQLNIAFAGTQVIRGHGKAVVYGTGINTEIGKIATLVSESTKIETPLQRKIKKLSKFLGAVVLAICAVIFIIGLIFNKPLIEIFLLSVALTVSAVPEGLPAVITISLALGAKKMLEKNVLVRKLESIENLGAINVICSDKTGTITKNQMELQKYYCEGEIYQANEIAKNKKSFDQIIEVAINCNSVISEEIGDPTEVALYVYAKEQKAKKYEKIDEIPFSSEDKFMATMHKIDGEHIIYKKGAIEVVLKECEKTLEKGKIRNFKTKEKEKIFSLAEELAKENYRILAFSYKTTNKNEIKEHEHEMIFAGFVCLMDPPRPHAKKSIAEAKSAGIRTIMITGDNITTAKAIANSVGIEGEGMTGQELEELSEKELEKKLKTYSIFARVNPEHKMRILKALQKKGLVVSMTGDGVNDAPALKSADVGVAMGNKGTDTARAASDIILLYDDFSDIPRGIFTGRTIDDNIQKFIVFLLSCNFKEIIIVLFSILFALPLPFLPIHILWLNLVTDSFPALALSNEPAEKDIKTRPPKKRNESIFEGKKAYIIFATLIGSIVVILSFAMFSNWFSDFSSINHIRSAVILQAIFLEMLFVFSVRTDDFIFNKHFFTNKYLHASVVLVICLHFILMSTPILSQFFQIEMLTSSEILLILILALIGVLALEIIKFFSKKLKCAKI